MPGGSRSYPRPLRFPDLRDRVALSPSVTLALHAAGAIVIGAYITWWLDRGRWMNDTYGFWAAWEGGLYDMPWLERGAYVYSPAFAQAFSPLSALPWESVWTIWLLVQVAALVLLIGPFWSGVVLLLPWPSVGAYPNAVVATIQNGNPQLLVAVAIAAGLRWPGAWAFPLLTKVTPGIGLLWYVVRREWTGLAWALGVTAAIVIVSFAFDPGLWLEWGRLLWRSVGADTLTKEPLIPLPFAVRAPMAIAVIVWGAATGRYWTVPVASMLALPAIQLGGVALLVAALPFLGLPLTPRWMLPPTVRADHSREPVWSA